MRPLNANPASMIALPRVCAPLASPIIEPANGLLFQRTAMLVTFGNGIGQGLRKSESRLIPEKRRRSPFQSSLGLFPLGPVCCTLALPFLCDGDAFVRW